MQSNTEIVGDRLLLTVDEVCRRLSLSRATIYRMVRSRELSTIRVGRALRVPADRLQHWIDRQQHSEVA
jgi:excisionase family DNA binding protein